jgi:hypothetical protein
MKNVIWFFPRKKFLYSEISIYMETLGFLSFDGFCRENPLASLAK